MSKVNRKYKDRLFRLIFQDKKELLTLYNALNETAYVIFYNGPRDEPDRRVLRLSDAFYPLSDHDFSVGRDSVPGTFEPAVRQAISYCIRHGILADILSVHTEEVVEMFLTDYDFEEHMRLIGRDSYAEGVVHGKAECVCQLLEDICQLPDSLRNRIMSETNEQLLDKWFKIAARAKSLEEFLGKTDLTLQSRNPHETPR